MRSGTPTKSKSLLYLKNSAKTKSKLFVGCNNLIQLESFQQISLHSEFNEFIGLMIENKIHFFQSADLFETPTKTYLKAIIWSMETTHRILFECLVKHIQRTRKSRAILLPFLFYEGTQYPPKLRQFLHFLFDEIDYVFDREGGEIHYNCDGTWLSSTKDFLWKSYFELPYISSNVFVMECAVYMTDAEIIQTIIKGHELMSEYAHQGRLIGKIAKRIQDALSSFTIIFKEMVCKHAQQILDSEIFRSGLLDKSFLEHLKDRLAHERTQVNLMTKTTDAYRLKRRAISDGIQSLADIDSMVEKNVAEQEEFFNLKPTIAARQLVLFDQGALKNVHFSEFYSTNRFKTLQIYINKVKIIESLTCNSLKETPTKKMFTFFIKAARECVEIGDYNVSYMIYTSMVKFSIEQPKGWTELKRSTKCKWDELESLFSISGNNKAYLESYEEHSSPKIPITALWMGEVIRYSDLNTYNEDGSLNMIKITKISKIMNKLLGAREMSFSYQKIEKTQKFLSTYSSTA